MHIMLKTFIRSEVIVAFGAALTSVATALIYAKFDQATHLFLFWFTVLQFFVAAHVIQVALARKR